MDAQPQFRVRVLLLNDATACTLDFASPFDVTCVTPDSNAQPQQKLFENLDAPITVSVAASRISIAGRPYEHEDRHAVQIDMDHKLETGVRLGELRQATPDLDYDPQAS